MPDLCAPLAVVCHDAGAASIILAWLRAKPVLELRAWMGGPAARLWAQTFGDRGVSESLDVALDGAAALLSGTGWASDMEHEARRSARERGVPSIAVIDHWVNYEARFCRNGSTVWPDEFWVTDEYALEEARRCFPASRVRLQPNLYLEEQLTRISPVEANKPIELLYVLEPTRNDWGKGEPGEFQALDYFARHMASLGLPRDTVVRLRPHPSDPEGKYESWLRGHSDFNARLDDSADLSGAIDGCQWVVGCESFAMVIALLSGRTVVCTLTAWAHSCRIPHRGIIHLKQVAARQREG